MPAPDRMPRRDRHSTEAPPAPRVREIQLGDTGHKALIYFTRPGERWWRGARVYKRS